jgi:hypothetical protein
MKGTKIMYAKSTLTILLTTLALTASAFARDPMTKEEISNLPQDKVTAVNQYCTKLYPDGEFVMRLYCEDKEYKALQILLTRSR